MIFCPGVEAGRRGRREQVLVDIQEIGHCLKRRAQLPKAGRHHGREPPGRLFPVVVRVAVGVQADDQVIFGIGTRRSSVP
jgi:hypothetical protein